MKFTEMALAASGRLVTNCTFFEMPPGGGAAAGAADDADAAATTPATTVATWSPTTARKRRGMGPISTGRPVDPAVSVGYVLSAVLGFAAASTLIVLAPGPDTLVVV